MVEQFRDTSRKLNRELSKEDRQAQGIFFTPKNARSRAFEKLRECGVTAPATILEPSFGSGEFILDARDKYPAATILGVEKNEKAYAALPASPRTHLTCADFLTWTGEGTARADLILGNPPYFVIKDKNPACMTGRPNIYVAFLYKCLTQHLAPGGILAFVLPPSLSNCSYYEPMRRYIAKHCTIRHVEELDVNYYQTSQDTMLLILENRPDPRKAFLFERGGSLTLSPHAEKLKALTAGATSLKELGLSVKTGDVVWNQEKEKLVDAEKGGVVLIYSTNIVNGELVLGNIRSAEKKQYIKGFRREARHGPAILVNRGYGNTYSFNFVRLEPGVEFFAENHVNMILPTTPAAEASLTTVMKSFVDPRTSEFIQCYFGNGAISKTELESVLPIWP